MYFGFCYIVMVYFHAINFVNIEIYTTLISNVLMWQILVNNVTIDFMFHVHAP